MIIRLYMIIHNYVYSIYIYIITPKLCQFAKNLVFRQASWVEFWMVHGSGKGTMFSSAPSRRTRWHGYQASTIHPATSWRWRKPETNKNHSTFLGVELFFFGVLTEMVRQLAKIRSWFENCFKNRWKWSNMVQIHLFWGGFFAHQHFPGGKNAQWCNLNSRVSKFYVRIWCCLFASWYVDIRNLEESVKVPSTTVKHA